MSSNKEAMIKKLGSEEAYTEYMRQIASKGGKKKHPNKGMGSYKNARISLP